MSAKTDRVWKVRVGRDGVTPSIRLEDLPEGSYFIASEEAMVEVRPCDYVAESVTAAEGWPMPWLMFPLSVKADGR